MTKEQLIQPTGFHLRLSSEWQVSAVSANIGDYLPVSAEQALGQPVTDLLSEDAIHDMRNRMALLRGEETVEHLLRVSLTGETKPLDLSIYRHGNGFGFDAEPSDGHGFGDATAIVDGMLTRLAAAKDVGAIGKEAARQLRALTGFDRVLVVGDGKVIGQSIRPGHEEFEPTAIDSDITHLAVTDCDADPVTILSHERSLPSQSILRVASDSEARCIASQQARAAMMLPLQRDGRAWGHVGCYHSVPRHVGVERRSVASLFARFISLQIEVAELRRG